MATHNLQTQFVAVVNQWERRLRLQQTMEWLPRAIMPGLTLGVALALYSRTRPGFSDGQVVLMTVIAVAAVVLAVLAFIWLKPTPVIRSAQRFDQWFSLKERVSTAIELMEGKIRSDPSLAEHQVDDAWETARGVRYEQEIPLGINRRDWMTVASLLVGFIVIMLLFTPALADPSAQAQQRAAITSAEEDLKEIIEDIATDANLQEEEREELLEALQTNLETLQDENITTEEAFATLSEAESTLREQAESLEEQVQMQQSALAEASEAMQQALPEQTAAESPAEALQALMDSLENMTPEQQQAAAEALEQAAAALEQSAPEVAESLRQAAEALRQGDPNRAQEALESAMQQLQQAQQNSQQQNQSAQQFQQAAQQAQEAGQEVAGQQPPNNQQGQEGQPGEAGQPSLQEQQGLEGQTGQQPGENGQPGEGEQPGQGNQPGEANQPGEQGEGDTEGSQSGTGSGAGDAPGDLSQAVPENRPGNDPNASRDNNPDGLGSREYDPVFAPNNIGGEGGDEVRLQADPDETPLQEGEFSSNPEGQATVPYDQVFSSYADAASRALDSDYIPLGLRDVIRDYFTSLDPQTAPPTQP